MFETEIKYARVIQFNNASNSENEVYRAPMEIGLRPCLIRDDLAIDVENFQLYRILDGNMDPSSLESDILYVDRIFTPDFDNYPAAMESLQKSAKEAEEWYEVIIKPCDEDKIINFQLEKRKYHENV